MDRNDMVAKVQKSASAVAGKVRDARLDDRAAELADLAREKVREAELSARAAEVAAAARQKLQESGADELAADLVARVRETPVAQQAAGMAGAAALTARQTTERTLDRVGDTLSQGRAGEALRLRRRRRWTPWPFIVAAAVVAGVAAGVVMIRRRDARRAEEFPGSEFDLASQGSAQDSAVRVVDVPLDARVREALGQDLRTANVGPLNVNVVDGTVFVRGFVGPDVDTDALRSVIAGVEGVTDVDLQVNVTA